MKFRHLLPTLLALGMLVVTLVWVVAGGVHSEAYGGDCHHPKAVDAEIQNYTTTTKPKCDTTTSTTYVTTSSSTSTTTASTTSTTTPTTSSSSTPSSTSTSSTTSTTTSTPSTSTTPPSSTQPPSLQATILTPICDNEVPKLQYQLSLVAAAAVGDVKVRWKNPTGNDVVQSADTSGTVLWPGAVQDASGRGIDWPGWIQQADGTWVQGDDGFAWVRPQVTVEFTYAGQTISVIVGYPPSSPNCATEPPMTPAPPVTITVPPAPPGVTIPPTR